MANINIQGNKTVRCCHNHINTIPFQETFFKCSTCGCYTMVSFFGALKDSDDNHVYWQSWNNEICSNKQYDT